MDYMTTEGFNKKYKYHLEEGHYGLDINDEKVIEYLDKLFPKLIEDYPDFEYSQIKTKFTMICFYCNLPSDVRIEVESKIKQLLDGSNN